MEIKEKLVALRKEKGLTQLAVAEKLNVSRQAISRWESGIALPSTDNLKSLSALYGVQIDYLLFLYSRESTTEPILYAALSKSSAAVTFSNLTSATSYKVAGKISSGTAPVTLKITD